MIQKSWRIAPADVGLVRELAAALGVSAVTAEVLVRRGFDTADAAQAFLRPDHKLHSPYLLRDMRAAVDRVDLALKRGEPIAVYGDYDADGITATFLLTEVLRGMGANVSWRLPNRFSDGYGLSAAVVEELAAEDARLLITVDCGVTAVAEVEQAKTLGMDVLITDHHEPRETLPDCIVINPKLGSYPFRHLAGVGVALKLAHALMQPRGEARVELPLALRPYVDVVAIGTVADIVPLHDENRTLVTMGLGRLRSAPRPGLAALIEAAGLLGEDMTAGKVGFRLAPRLNAAGRLEDATTALHLLAASSRAEALPLALRLNELNQARQEIEATMLAEALAMVPDPPPPAIVLGSPDWHEGVVGIVASRLVDRLYRPTILLSVSDDVAKGSGRSIAGFDLLAAVTACSAPLTRFGGHKAACGLSLPPAKVGRFREAFTAYAASQLGETELTRRLTVDAVVCGDELTLALADELEQLAPHGFGNPKVTLLLHGAEIQSPRLTRTREHLQCKVRADGVCASAIHFNFKGLDQLADGRRYDVPLALGKNAYNGSVKAQVEVQALLPLEQPAIDVCATACCGDCAHAERGDDLWRRLEALAAGGLAGLVAADGQPVAARGESKRDGAEAAGPGRLDCRGRPLVSTLARVAAGGGRVLLLVADVAHRRPLLTRDLPLAYLDAEGVYLHGGCLANRLGVAVPATGREPRLVVADCLTAAATPQLVAAFDQIVFVDPPFDRATLDAVAAAAGDGAWLHFVWGQGEVHFSEQVLTHVYDLDQALRRLWRAAGDDGDLTAALQHEHLAGPVLAEPLVLAAAVRTLREAGLLAPGGGKNLLRPAQGKVDLATSETYRAWRQRFQTKTFLARCLTARF